MLDFKLDKNGDLALDAVGDITTTQSVVQAVVIRLRWFFQEWRLGPQMGVPYYEDILVKNPNDAKIKNLIRQQVMSVDEVRDVNYIELQVDKKTRDAKILLEFSTDEETFREEVKIVWQENTD